MSDTEVHIIFFHVLLNNWNVTRWSLNLDAFPVLLKCIVVVPAVQVFVQFPCRYWEKEKVRLDYRPVHMETLDDEIEPFPPKARVY